MISPLPPDPSEAMRTDNGLVPVAPEPEVGTQTGAPGDAAWVDARASAQAARAAEARKHSGRRTHIDPATCERDYSSDELEFMSAMAEYKKRSGRLFPTWSEVLEVLHDLGYRKSDADDDGGPPLLS